MDAPFYMVEKQEKAEKRIAGFLSDPCIDVVALEHSDNVCDDAVSGGSIRLRVPLLRSVDGGTAVLRCLLSRFRRLCCVIAEKRSIPTPWKLDIAELVYQTGKQGKGHKQHHSSNQQCEPRPVD